MAEMKKVVVAIAASAVVIIPIFLGFVYYEDVSAIENSEISISNASISELRPTYCKIRLQMELKNPSARQISDISVKFDIYISDNYVGSGYFPEITVPPHSARMREMNITIYYANLTGAVVNALYNGEVVISIRGEMEGKILYDMVRFSQPFNTSYSIV